MSASPDDLIKTLTVLYDAECELCRRCTRWLADQPAYVELRFLPFQYEEGLRQFEGLDRRGLDRQLHAIADDGAVYRGADAWIMCLYALKEYRAWSYRLAAPGLRELAQKFCEAVAANRLTISQYMPFHSDSEIQHFITASEDTIEPLKMI